MDPFYAFLIFAVVVFLDILAAQTWLGPYFRFGIPVYLQRVTPARPPRLDALEAEFKSSPLNPTIRFKALASDWIAFRERLFENRSGLRYLPIFHSSLYIRPAGGPVTIVGLLNGYVIAALAYGIYRTTQDPTYAPVAVLILVVLVLSYFGQASVNQRLAKYIAGEA